ncbi:MAG: hypothetical protein LN546_03020 [Rickettsia endosymbiont of Ecitomorpha arachnoides]|nr:hypothetical protein [Rickettsia endosymbiont of Ecitomorpha arachnoides]
MAKELIPDRPQEKLKTAFEYQVDSAAGIIRKLEEKVTLALKEPSLIKRQDLHLQAVGAAITLYSPEVANQYLNDTEIQKLADLLKENKKYIINLLPKEKDIYEKLVAKNEAIIKGFPISFDGVADHITVKVQAKAYKNAVESALIEMSVGDEQIPRKKYGEELLKRVKEKLDKPFYDEVTKETVEISEETISEAEKLIKKANKNIDLQQTPLTPDQKVEVQNAFKSTIDKLCKFLEKNIETNKNIKQGIDIIRSRGK